MLLLDDCLFACPSHPETLLRMPHICKGATASTGQERLLLLSWIIGSIQPTINSIKPQQHLRTPLNKKPNKTKYIFYFRNTPYNMGTHKTYVHSIMQEIWYHIFFMHYQRTRLLQLYHGNPSYPVKATRWKWRLNRGLLTTIVPQQKTSRKPPTHPSLKG